MSLEDNIKTYGKQIFYFCLIASAIFVMGVDAIAGYQIHKMFIIGLLGGAAYIFNKMYTDLKGEVNRLQQKNTINNQQQQQKSPSNFQPHFQQNENNNQSRELFDQEWN
jgi:hypothetical protein